MSMIPRDDGELGAPGGMVFVGAWNPDAIYRAGSVVSKGGALYVAVAKNGGTDPEEANSTDWVPLAPERRVRHNAAEGLQGGTDSDRWHLSEDEARAAQNAEAPSALNPYVTRHELPTLEEGVGDFRRVEGVPEVGMLYDAAHGNGLFVAVGENCAIRAEKPAGEWTEEAAPPGNWRGVCYGLDRFVAVGLRGAAMCRDDQIHSVWREIAGFPRGDWNKIAHGNGMYIAVTDGAVAVSPDGQTGWAKRTVPEGYGADIAFDNGVFIAVGRAGAMTSADGEAWEERETPGFSYRAVASEGGETVMLGGRCAVTRDGFATVEEAETPRGGWDAACFGGGFVAAIGGGTACMVSPAGRSLPPAWEDRETPNYAMLGLTFGDDCFVAVGDGVMAAGVIDVGAALRGANAPSGSNPFATAADVDEMGARTREELWAELDGLFSVFEGL